MGAKRRCENYCPAYYQKPPRGSKPYTCGLGFEYEAGDDGHIHPVNRSCQEVEWPLTEGGLEREARKRGIKFRRIISFNEVFPVDTERGFGGNDRFPTHYVKGPTIKPIEDYWQEKDLTKKGTHR